MAREWVAVGASAVLMLGCAGTGSGAAADMSGSTAPTIQASAATAPGAPAAPVPPAAPAGATCTVTRTSNGAAADAVRLCRTGTTIAGLQANDNLSNYYGFVSASTLSMAIDATSKKSLGDFLYRIFRTSDFTAQISVIIEIHTAGGVTPLAERPLVVVQKKGNVVNVETNGAALQDTQITPAFALDEGAPTVNVRFRIRRTDDVNFQAVQIARAGSDAAAAAGGSGWVINGLANAVIFDALTKSQTFVSDYFSDDVTVSTVAPLAFAPGGLSTATFETGWSEGAPSLYKIEVKLGVVQSQITRRLRERTAGGLRVPDVITPEYAPAVGTWASNIVVIPTVGATPSKRLNNILAEQGVPRALADLDPAGSTSSLTTTQRVDRACQDLRDALRSDQYFRLNQTDTALIVYDQLARADVFRRFQVSEMQCVNSLMPVWTGRFGLTPVVVDPPIPTQGRTARMDQMARQWKLPTVEGRAEIASNFVSPLSIDVPLGLFPDLAAALTEEEAGFGRGQVNATALKSLQATCFGSYDKTTSTPFDGWALVKFNGLTGSYLVQMTFVNVPGLGTLARSLRIRSMTAADKVTYAGKDCVD